MSSDFLGRLFGGGRHGGNHGGGHGGGHRDDHGYGYGSPWGAPAPGPVPTQPAPGSFSQPGWTSLPQAPAHDCNAAAERVLVCPSCRSDNAPDSRFCAQCGQRLGPAEQACKCGAVLAPGVKFCPSCGAAAAGASA